MSTPVTEPARGTPAPHRLEQVDAVVATARRAAEQFRSLDQAAVDRIVLAMVKAGLTAAGDLARLALDETGFGSSRTR
jgi:acetaldehyde dehydrogenase/alcohol dehydrogenase